MGRARARLECGWDQPSPDDPARSARRIIVTPQALETRDSGFRVGCRRWLAMLFVCVFAIVDRDNVDDAFVLVDAIEETKLA